MSPQLAFGASKSPSPPSPSPCQSPSPCESASASVPHLHLHHHLHLHVHHHLRLRLHLHRHPHRLISVLLLRLIHNTKRYDRCRVGGCPEGLAIMILILTMVSYHHHYNCKPFGAPADPSSATPLCIQYFMYYMGNIVVRRRRRTNTRR